MYESHASQLYKISVTSAFNNNKWLKEPVKVANRHLQGGVKSNLEKAWGKADDLGSLGTHITGYFTDKLRDYSLVSPDQIEAMK